MAVEALPLSSVIDSDERKFIPWLWREARRRAKVAVGRRVPEQLVKENSPAPCGGAPERGTLVWTLRE